MFWPCETRTSTCRNFATISSGLYRFLAITVLLDVKDIPQVGPLQWGWITIMTQNQIGSPEQRLALNVCYGIIGTVGISILCRDLGVGLSVVPWVLYAIFATPMIVMLSHREVVGAPLLTRGIRCPRFTFYLAKRALGGED